MTSDYWRWNFIIHHNPLIYFSFNKLVFIHSSTPYGPSIPTLKVPSSWSCPVVSFIKLQILPNFEVDQH